MMHAPRTTTTTHHHPHHPHGLDHATYCAAFLTWGFRWYNAMLQHGMQIQSSGGLAMDLVFGAMCYNVTCSDVTWNWEFRHASPPSERVSRWASSLVLSSSTALGPPRRCATSSGAPLVENVTHPG